MDPQQRQSLEITDEAIQDAGYTKDTLPRDTGVYVGIGIMDFPGSLMENRYLFKAHTLTGISQSCAANRISHHYGLTGPSVAVDTACAASLTALHVACMSLWNHENKVALAGATSNIFSPETTVAFSHLGVLSATGNSAPFDESNNGYVRGEGTSMVVMKSLEDAIRDGDHIYCVIRASTSAHNGNSNSLTLPSADAQEELIRKCYRQFGVPMDKVSFVEAHGTGTPVGDPLETKALGRTFGEARRASSLGPMPIQSAKSNFGHLEVAAGMVQVVKTALMLEKRLFYKQNNWSAPNPRINFDDLNLYIPLKAEPYTRNEKFVIGVNTFGFGGSLVHMIFEEYRPRVKSGTDENQAGWSFGSDPTKGRKIAIPLSAKVGISLRNTVEKWMAWEDDADAQSVAGWLATRRDHFSEHRMVVLADSGMDFRNKLQKWLDNEDDEDVITGSRAVVYEKPNICLVYPGWGQQWADMGRNLYKNSPILKAAVDECDSIFKNISGYSALEKFQIFVDAPVERDPGLIDGAACKPGILFLQVGLTRLLSSWGVTPDVVMGIGLGEQAAGYASGAMSLEEIIRLMHIRMSAPPKEEFLTQVSDLLTGEKTASAKFISTITGREFDQRLDADYWWQNVIGKPKTTASIETVLEQNSNTIFIEVSASASMKDVIQASMEQHKTDVSATTVMCCGEKNRNDWESVQRVMASLHVSGYPVSWADITRHLASYSPVPLYGWDDRIYRVEARDFGSRRLGLIDRSFRNTAGQINMDLFSYLRDYSLHDEMVFPAAAYVEYFSEYDDCKLAALKDITIHKNIKLLPLTADGYLQTVKLDMKQDKSSLSVRDVDDQVMAEATLTRVKHIQDPPTMDIKNIQQRCPDILEGSEVYTKFSSEGLSYGIFFKFIEQLYVGDMEALAKCNAPNSRNRFERIEAPILDNAFQTAIAAFTNGPCLYMPATIGHLQMFVEKIPPTTAFSVHAKLREWNLQYIVCDMTISDNDGNIWLAIENFRAESTADFTTDVDYDSCCYTTNWQSAESKMPCPVRLDDFMSRENSNTSDIASCKLQKLKPFVRSLAHEASGQVQHEATEDKLQHQSGKNVVAVSSDIVSEQILDTTPEISCEMVNLKNIAAELSKLPDSVSYAHQVAIFLRESSLLKEMIAPCKDIIKAMVNEALVHKGVVRVCDVSERSGFLTKILVQALEDEIESSRVDYTYAALGEDNFKHVNEYLSDLPAINFEQLDIENRSTFQGSYDLVISFDPIGDASVPLDVIKELLAPQGLVLLLKAKSCQFITEFLSLATQTPVHIDESSLRNAEFVDIREIASSDVSAITMLVGQKEARCNALQGQFVILHNDSPDIAKKLSYKLGNESEIYSTSDFAGDALSNQKDVTVVYLLGSSPDVNTTVDVLTILSMHDKGTVSALYAVAGMDGNDSDTDICIGILQHKANSTFPLYVLDAKSSSDLSSDVINAMSNCYPFEHQIHVEKWWHGGSQDSPIRHELWY